MMIKEQSAYFLNNLFPCFPGVGDSELSDFLDTIIPSDELNNELSSLSSQDQSNNKENHPDHRYHQPYFSKDDSDLLSEL